MQLRRGRVGPAAKSASFAAGRPRLAFLGRMPFPSQLPNNPRVQPLESHDNP